MESTERIMYTPELLLDELTVKTLKVFGDAFFGEDNSKEEIDAIIDEPLDKSILGDHSFYIAVLELVLRENLDTDRAAKLISYPYGTPDMAEEGRIGINPLSFYLYGGIRHIFMLKTIVMAYKDVLMLAKAGIELQDDDKLIDINNALMRYIDQQFAAKHDTE